MVGTKGDLEITDRLYHNWKMNVNSTHDYAGSNPVSRAKFLRNWLRQIGTVAALKRQAYPGSNPGSGTTK